MLDGSFIPSTVYGPESLSHDCFKMVIGSSKSFCFGRIYSLLLFSNSTSAGVNCFVTPEPQRNSENTCHWATLGIRFGPKSLCVFGEHEYGVSVGQQASPSQRCWKWISKMFLVPSTSFSRQVLRVMRSDLHSIL